jgi:hypothetical protein
MALLPRMPKAMCPRVAEIRLGLLGCPQPASLAPSAHCSACLPLIFAAQASLRWGRLTGSVVANPRPMSAWQLGEPTRAHSRLVMLGHW